MVYILLLRLSKIAVGNTVRNKLNEKNWEVKTEKMKTKTKKIFSLSVLVMCIAVFGLVSAVSAEPSIESILNGMYGVDGWTEITSTINGDYNFTFIPDTYTAVAVCVTADHGSYRDPVGWYKASDGTKTLLFPIPAPGCSTTFTPNVEFGLYIVASEMGVSPCPDNPAFYSEIWRNPDTYNHVRLFEPNTGGPPYALAFEDLCNGGG